MRVEAAGGQGVPDALGHERHGGVQQAHAGVQHEDEVALDLELLLGAAVEQAALAELDVPVADVAPEEGLRLARVVAEGVGLELLGGARHGAGQAAEHPGVLGGHGGRLARLVAREVHLHEAARVPDLGHEAAGLLGARAVDEPVGLLVDVGVELDVLVVGDEREEVVAHRVRAVLLHELHRVDAVALGLGHAAAVLGQDRGVDVDVVEGHLVREVQRAHDHAGHPQGDDVARGHEHLGGVVLGELGGVVGPALRGEGPQLAGEPGVEHVLVLAHVAAAALGARVHVLHEGVLPAAVLAVEHGDAVAPPQLARDAPVLEVVHPGEVGLGPALGVEGHLAGLHDLGGALFKLVHGHEPLLGEPGLERGVAAVAVHDGVVELLDLLEQAVLLEPRNHGLAALVARHAAELAVAVHHHGVLVEDVDLLEVVGLAHRKVVGVVGRRHLDEAGAEARVHVPVSEDRDLAVDDGQHHARTHELGLVRVGRRDGHARVTEHGLRARGGHGHVLNAVDGLHERVAQVPQVALLVLVLGLVVGDGGAAGGAPVDDALAAVDQAVVVPVAEDLAHRAGELGTHRELLVGEVDGAAHAADLGDDGAAVLARPVPAGVEELAPPNLQAGDALFFKLLVNLGLRGDAGVVGAQDPAGGAAAHAAVADEGVLDRVVHRVAHVQDARDVGRRDHDGAVPHPLAALVAAGALPGLDELGLGGCGIVGLGHLFHGLSSRGARSYRCNRIARARAARRPAPHRGAPASAKKRG